jgi:hypothetical protein
MLQSLMQYIGNDLYDNMIFLNVSTLAIALDDDDFRSLSGIDVYLTPYTQDSWSSHLNPGFGGYSGRYVVRDIGGIFVADEEHRDAHPSHLPGYNLIQQLKIGQIIPCGGFTTDWTLSILDKVIQRHTSHSQRYKLVHDIQIQRLTTRHKGKKMTWKLFLDDERDPPTNSKHSFMIARSTKQAMELIETFGLPIYMSLDHDLGGADTTMVFLNKLINYLLDVDKEACFRDDFSFYVHSMNPIGKINIEQALPNIVKEFSNPR